MKPFYFCFIFQMAFVNTFCQSKYSEEVETQIEKVENSLAGPLKIVGVKDYNIIDRMAYYKVKGLSLAVIKDYKIIWTKTYGWADELEKKPVTDTTLFQAASISKSINSLAVMKLVEDKKLELNKDINEYLVSWKFPYDSISKGKKITLLNLLTHTAGINNNGAMYVKGDSIPTVIEVLNGAKPSKYIYCDTTAVKSFMEPNIRFEYSNTGVGISQVIITDITGKNYEQYIDETIFKVLGMTNSCYTEESLKRKENFLATGYSNDDEVRGKHVIVPMLSAGGLWSTPTDLGKFICEIQLSYLGKSNKILSKDITRLLLTSYIDSAVSPGFFIRKNRPDSEKYFGHTGVTKGFRSSCFGSFNGGNAVVVMTNGGDLEMINELINSVASVYHWKDFYEPRIWNPK